MSRPRYLLDENMPHALREARRRVEPAVDVRVMGEAGCPPLETQDPELLAWLEQENRILVSRNRRTMPQHFAAHLQARGHVPGILMVREDFSMAELVEDLLLIWSASEADEWRDQLIYLPLIPISGNSSLPAAPTHSAWRLAVCPMRLALCTSCSLISDH